ncbi:transglutaminase domain-containing protein [Streptomyces sp. NPDC015131]|uniref:transglutaminase domain-containing protein n=1 Tax=Streptomyces sp. NPDC015131 TaxID=3364941 RepID=UPI0036FCB2FA
MTSTLLTPWWRARRGGGSGGRGDDGSVAATRILDHRHPAVRALLADARAAAGTGGERAVVLAAHGLISARVRPVYAMDDTRPASRTLRLGRGSCSQRLAVLEAVARAAGVPTRVRGLLVDGAFWYPRFPRLRRLVPDTVVLAWPEFRLGGAWVNASELYAPLEVLGAREPRGFTNTGSQTLFEALASTAVDWDGAGAGCGTGGCAAYDLSAMVRRDLGRFASRDELFAAHGQTLCPPARIAGGVLLSRVTPA